MVIQYAIAQRLTPIYENVFSDYSYGFRPNKDCHTAMNKVLEYLNNGFEWVIDLDIEKYFDIVNHKLISILREQVMIVTFTKLNQIIKGWINYSRIGSMKMFIDNFGQWLRYKVRVIIIKKWKKLMRIYIQCSKL